MNNVLRYSFLSSHNQHGLTLVEILVALVISLFLTAGVIQLFIGTKQTYRFQDSLSRIQENGRFAINTISTDIRMADFITDPYPPPAPLPALTDPPGREGFRTTAVQGTANNNNLITVRWFDPGAAPPQCVAANGICSRTYSIAARTSPTVPACASAATSLFLSRDGGAAQELIEGVEAMQVLFGEDITLPSDRVADIYVGAGAVNNWRNVVSVRIYLLLVSLEDNIVTESQTVSFPPDTVNVWPVGDRCLRQAFSTTVAVRNRLP